MAWAALLSVGDDVTLDYDPDSNSLADSDLGDGTGLYTVKSVSWEGREMAAAVPDAPVTGESETMAEPVTGQQPAAELSAA